MPVKVTNNTGPGWGCTCPAFRHGAPSPETAVKAMIKAANVNVEKTGKNEWRAWSDPKNKYVVVYTPDQPGGFCKHVAACAVDVVGRWLFGAMLGAEELQDEKNELRKEIKYERRRAGRD